MNKILFAIILITIVICIVTFVFSDQISMILAKDKPDNIIYCHPYFSTDIENSKVNSNEYVCFYSNDNKVSIKLLNKKTFLKYEYIDAVPTNYNMKEGKITSAYGTKNIIPSKNITIKQDGEIVEIYCVRAIVHYEEYQNNNLEKSFRNILCCEINKQLSEGVIFAAENGNEYEPISHKIINDKGIYIYEIKQDDLIVLNEISEKSFIVK